MKIYDPTVGSGGMLVTRNYLKDNGETLRTYLYMGKK